MAAFDKLPRRVREALANGIENWSPQAVALVMRGPALRMCRAIAADIHGGLIFPLPEVDV